MNNPFLIVGYQGPEYFCDREKETEVILSALHNGRNITLVSPRRMGKTGLIKNVFYTLQEKEKNAKCFYLDIFSTQNLREFVALLGREILGKLDSLSQSTLKTLLSFFKSCRPVITMDELSGIPSVSLDIVPSKEEETLKEIFDYLRQSGRECYLAIDEFQQIMEYPEKGVAIRSEEYYVNMMRAWYFATALAKQYEKILPFLEEQRMDIWTHNKTIQKSIESYRITQEQKDHLRTLRIKK